MTRDWLSAVFSWQLAAWSAFLLNVGAYLKIRNERLRDRATETNTETNGAWARMVELQSILSSEVRRLETRLIAVEAENEKRLNAIEAENKKCHENLANVRDELAAERAERMKFERLLQANDETREIAQRIVSTERQIDANKRGGAGK